MASLLRQRQPSSLMAREGPSSSPKATLLPSPSPTHTSTPFMSLPPEIHVMISRELIYPDALSLKHTNLYFYNLVDTGVWLKVSWLMQRQMLRLDCPKDKRCNLRTDREFCRENIRMLMRRRREHVECESRPGLGCLIYNTPQCAHRRNWRKWARRWKRQVTTEIWWVLLAAIPLLMGLLWVAELVGSAMA